MEVFYQRRLSQELGVFRSVNNDHSEGLMFNILELKLKAYDEFLSCTQLLGKSLASEDMPEVDRLIKRRSDLMRVIDELDGKIAVFRKARLSDQQFPMTRHVEKIFADINIKVKQIVGADKDCRIIAANQCSALEKAVKDSRREKTGLMKYFSKPRLIPKFLNIQS